MEQLTELLNYYSINGIPSNHYESRTKSISRQSSQHSQPTARAHHSTGSISSLSTILGGTTSVSTGTTITTTGQPANIAHNLHSLGTSFSSTTGIGNVTTAIAAAGIGLPSSITPIGQSPSVAKSKNAHAPLRNSKSTSSSLMTSQTGSQLGHLDCNVQLIKEGKACQLLGRVFVYHNNSKLFLFLFNPTDLTSLASFDQSSSSISEKQRGFKNQMKILKQSSLEQNLAEEELMYLESDWSVIVKNQNELNKKMHNQQVRLLFFGV